MTRVAGQIARIAVWSGVSLWRDRQVMFWNFGFFTVVLVLFLGVLSRGDASVQVMLTAATVTVAVMANGLFTVGIGLASARDRGVFRRFATTPVPGWTVVAAMVVARMVTIMLSAMALVLVARAAFGVRWSGGLSWLPVVVMGTIAFSTLGLVVAALAHKAHRANVVANVILIPMMAVGGTALPATMLPDPFDRLSSMLPSRALMDALVAAFVATGSATDILPGLVSLLGWAVAATALGAYAWKRRPA